LKNNFKPGRDKVLLMDGAMGTELIREGLDLSLPLWSGDINLTHPGYVSKIHEEYVQAGADIVTTNTFRTTPRTYIHAGYSKLEAKVRARKSLNSAVDLAKKSAGEKCYVAGSIAPLEDCYSPERFPGDEEALEEFYELGKWLATTGQQYQQHSAYQQLVSLNKAFHQHLEEAIQLLDKMSLLPADKVTQIEQASDALIEAINQLENAEASVSESAALPHH